MKTTLILAISLLALLSVASSQTPDPYRLLKTVQPINYKLDLTLGADFYTAKKFGGTVKIRFQTANQEVLNVVLHSVELKYNKENIILKKLNDPKEIAFALDQAANAQDFITIHPILAPLEKNTTYELEFKNYEGRLWEDMYGFYLSSYKDNNNNVFLATTQFQPTHARRVFPCFDEPSFKATFDITITHPQEYNAVVANTQTKAPAEEAAPPQKKTAFVTTPKMSTYLVAFMVSKFDKLSTNANYSVYARKDVKETLNYGHNTGKELLRRLEDYAGIPYNTYIAKLDQAAIPDFAAGAMENWGLITYRETALLWDKAQSTRRNKQSVACTIAHEMTHMWFGDLVTTDWWSTTWLNEGFARYFQYFIAAEVEDKWQLDKQFVVEQQHTVFGADALTSSLAMNSDASTPAQIQTKFDSISYNKGACVIRMMRHFLGETYFKAGLQKYLKDNEFGSVVPKDLFDALQTVATGLPQGRTLELVMKNWVEKSGYPVVHVTLDKEDRVVLSQERFLLKDKDATNSKWVVPISYATSKDGKNFTDTLPKRWLLEDVNTTTLKDVKIQGEDWIILNVQETGYYRVNYDKKLWKNIGKALHKKDFDGIHEINRAQIVDDALNLARAKKITYDAAFDAISFLDKDVSYYPWYSAYAGFSFLLKRIGNEEKLGKHLKEHILKLSGAIIKANPLDKDLGENDHVETLTQSLAQQWACQLGQEDCVKKAKEMFAKFQSANEAVKPDKRSIVYCTGIRESKERAAWDFLWGIFKNTQWAHEQNTILAALGCTKDEALLKEYLQKSISGTEIRKQDTVSVFTAVCNSSPTGLKAAFEFLKGNLKKIIAQYGGMNALGKVVTALANGFTTKEEIEDLKQFYEANKDDFEKAGNEVKKALETATANLEIKATLEKELLPWFTKGSSTTIAVNLTLLLGCIVFVLLR